ncbi:MAG: hypothetical protein ACE5JZ_06015, partial [Kiloniellales bacterium]
GKGRLSLGGARSKVGKVLGDRASSRKPPSVDQDTPDRPAAEGRLRLGGVSADERLTPSSEGDDLLDIPAFLRRQAN